VRGDHVGVTASGTAALGNGVDGVTVSLTAGVDRDAGVISGNGGDGTISDALEVVAPDAR
jgi:hypothetical protein